MRDGEGTHDAETSDRKNGGKDFRSRMMRTERCLMHPIEQPKIAGRALKAGEGKRENVWG